MDLLLRATRRSMRCSHPNVALPCAVHKPLTLISAYSCTESNLIRQRGWFTGWLKPDQQVQFIIIALALIRGPRAGKFE
jgi:hypothetical protein